MTNENKFKPITLQCPYCHATLQQDWHVECKCGWIAEAISEAVVNSFKCFEIYTVTLDKTKWTFNPDLNKPNYMRVVVHNINNIHWLELNGGKTDEL